MWVAGGRRTSPRTAAGSDLKPYGNDRLRDHSQAGVVVAGVPAHALVGLIDADRVLMRGDPFGLLDDNPRLQRPLELLAQLLLLAQLRGVDDVAGRHVGQHHGHRDVLIRPLAWLGRVDVEGADGLAGEPHRDTGHAGHTNPDSSTGKIWPSSGLSAHVGDSN